MMAAIVFALVALAAVLAVMRYGLPDWVPFARTTFAEAQSGLVLDFPRNRQDRRTLPNGTEFFGASGTITFHRMRDRLALSSSAASSISFGMPRKNWRIRNVP